MHIVVVEDHVPLAKGIAYQLRDAGHAVDLLHDGDAADAFLRGDGADLVVLDVNLPGRDGIAVLRGMRARGDLRPVLMLTARAGTDDKVAGLDAGADDYLAKPFEMAELAARIRALSRRTQAREPDARRIGSLRFDPAGRTLEGPDGPIALPRRELALLEALLAAEGRTVPKQRLLDSLYGTGADVGEEVVEVYVSRLRKRLKPHGVEIRVARGLGYVLRAPS
ncbi:response regulator transcription factor [Jannaschia sp. W003]|uniref:response regulator transcription factor n=1 Tax=Jannaschia sp. W003 TaxID=2867012 RepID=UPI0021A3CB3D|nr:response regulator transcription factor [Jannaschia sp. W003]UWQ23094.1 response regulator transcription factor [Jannaschia sp. W003]